MNHVRIWIATFWALLWLAGAGHAAQGVADQRLNITLDGKTYNLAARVYRPAGEGPFPLMVINHGTPVSIKDAPDEKIGFKKAALWFQGQGYMVLLAQRPGFGTSDGPYLEQSSPCDHRNYVSDGQATARVEAAIAHSGAALPDVDPKRVVVIGQSAGGFGVIAMADAPPPGVLGVISFAGGRGGDDHNNICSGEQRLIDAAGTFGKSNKLPQLWLYAANDHFFAPPLAHAMHKAYSAGSKPQIQFIDLPPFADDGHGTFGRGYPSIWANYVSAFLIKIGATPAASDNAPLNQAQGHVQLLR